MTRIVYNACFGGFSLSQEGRDLYCKLAGVYPVHPGNFYDRDLSRTDPIRLQVVDQLGSRANGGFAQLQVRELAPGVKYRIDEYDGNESVKTIDEYEWSVA